MFGSRDFPTLKWKFALNCSEFAHYRKLKIAQLNALSLLHFSTANLLQFTSRNLEIS